MLSKRAVFRAVSRRNTGGYNAIIERKVNSVNSLAIQIIAKLALMPAIQV